MDITRGSLDSITHPATNERIHYSPASTVSLATPMISQHERESINALQILPSQSPYHNMQEYDLEVMELFSSDSDHEFDNCSDSLQGTAASCNSSDHSSNTSSDEDESLAASVLSDQPGGSADGKLLQAMSKIKQLDIILSETTLKEKRVRRQGLRVRQAMEEDLKAIESAEDAEISSNTRRFLELKPLLDVSEDLVDIEPVFQTQFSDADSSLGSGSYSERRKDSDRSSQSEDKHKGRKRRPNGKGSNRNQNGGSDFIQRNIDLASDAVSAVAMTDDEKKRINELLQDIEMLGGEDSMPESGNALLLSHGVAFIPDSTEQAALEAIDAKLKTTLPAEQYDCISTTPSQERMPTQRKYSAVDLGEKILRDAKNERFHQERLAMIEDELVSLEDRADHEIYSSQPPSQAKLSEILQECSVLSTRARTVTNSMLDAAAPHNECIGDTAQELVPSLPLDVLQALLSEARESCLSESLQSLNTPVGSLDDSGVLTSRTNDGDPPRTVVSPDTIQLLLRNPRATSVNITTTGSIYNIADPNQEGSAEMVAGSWDMTDSPRTSPSNEANQSSMWEAPCRSTKSPNSRSSNVARNTLTEVSLRSCSSGNEYSTPSLSQSPQHWSLPEIVPKVSLNLSSSSNRGKYGAQSRHGVLRFPPVNETRTDSHASTVASSDFEYENDDELMAQLLARDNETSSPRHASQLSRQMNISRFEKLGSASEIFGPPLL